MQQGHTNLLGIKFHGTSKLSKIRLMENAADDELTDLDQIALCSRRLRKMHFSAECIGYVDIAGRSTAMGRQTSAGWKCLKITRQVALRLLHSSLASFFVFR